ncbi:class I SAM-dependent methyltransferase [Luteimonas kalidii]|uniref:Class I SAM-dependent methyltransferase n=1 Tax=Luteimonas kalidii TaxID=3042025 RepID=A0ABT6JQZ9_9GAMM|nr:class I SAM-dependent methyltransferase [Luteimonas kalidii]MDH5833039.1 class I SAM-dependent methyltransferase [Luteimonas kalidii]
MQALDVVGSDVDHHECPRCGAHDRERHLLLYMQTTGLLTDLGGMRILHFAPERRLARLIAARSPVSYVQCDLYPTSPEVRKVDIAAMPFSDESFDLVMANHVLEHVDDDAKAVQEISRVLAKGGWAILQTPYSPVLHKTWCDHGVVDDMARLHAYGQEDHVRLFGRDIVERISSSGLRPETGTHAGLLSGVDHSLAGVNPREPFFLFRKPS